MIVVEDGLHLFLSSLFNEEIGDTSELFYTEECQEDAYCAVIVNVIMVIAL